MKFGLQITLSRKISRRYAQAFLDSAEQNKSLELVHADFQMIDKVLKSSTELRDFIDQPYLAAGLAESVLGELFKNKIQPLTFDILLFLIYKGRLNILNEIIETFDELYQQKRQISRIQIVSAIELTKEQINTICAKLKARWNREVEAENTLDPSLIGGFCIKSGDQVLDYSMKILLENYRQQVINA